jgi:hypothetical protein
MNFGKLTILLLNSIPATTKGVAPAAHAQKIKQKNIIIHKEFTVVI